MGEKDSDTKNPSTERMITQSCLFYKTETATLYFALIFLITVASELGRTVGFTEEDKEQCSDKAQRTQL